MGQRGNLVIVEARKLVRRLWKWSTGELCEGLNWLVMGNRMKGVRVEDISRFCNMCVVGRGRE